MNLSPESRIIVNVLKGLGRPATAMEIAQLSKVPSDKLHDKLYKLERHGYICKMNDPKAPKVLGLKVQRSVYFVAGLNVETNHP